MEFDMELEQAMDAQFEEEAKRPGWVLRGGQIDEVLFCREYLQNNALISVDGVFYTLEGRMQDEQVLRQAIFDQLAPYVRTGLHKRSGALVETLRLMARDEDDQLCEKAHVLHMANGTYDISDGFFMTQKVYCRHRLPVAYNREAPKPKRWLSFLEELLEPEDIPTLQEFMGYCLIPVNYGQKMLLITGRGGEGKSRIGLVLKALLGSNMHLGSIAKIENNRFARADLEHLLLLLDDDLVMEALNQTSYIKSIITAELPMDLERKGIQSYQGMLNVRFMAFGNGNLRSLHDKSYGFFRRQIILTAKEPAPDRKNDPYLGSTLVKEREGIFLWCLEGLERLICNDFQFTISPQAQNNLQGAISEGNNLEDFLASEGYIRLTPHGKASSRQIYEVYEDWCRDNLLKPLSSRTLWTYLTQNATRFGLTPSCHIPAGNGKTVRGFHGIQILSRF